MTYTGIDDPELFEAQKKINRLESLAADGLIRDYWERKLYQESICKDLFYTRSEPLPPEPWYKKAWRRVCWLPIWHLHIVDIRDYHKEEDCDW